MSSDQTNKVAILTVATNNYLDFLPRLYASLDLHFLAECDVTYYIFTNHPERVAHQSNRQIVKVPIVHESWPMMTLKRYHLFNSKKEELSKFSHLFYMDIDMEVVAPIHADEILPNTGIVATQHPGFYNKSIRNFSYERNPNSQAYIPPTAGRHYFAGGFNGGTAADFLRMAGVLKAQIDTDFNHNIIAKWHDESHMNKYLWQHQPTKILSPAYCYPESWELPFEKKIIALDKKHKDYQK